MGTIQLQPLVPDEIASALRDCVRGAYRDQPGYAWLGEDILEELEEVIDDELALCRDLYPASL